MEQIGTHIKEILPKLQVEKKSAQETSLAVSGKPVFSDPDKRIIEKKYASAQIGMLGESQRMTWAKVLLLKIHVITGWTIPSDEDLTTILIDQFSKKLIEDYPELNVDEIEYAFRQTGTMVKDWGKALNLNLIDEVLIPYVNQRSDLSREEEKKAPKPAQTILTDAQLLDIQRGDIEAFYQRIRGGWIPTYKIPEYFRVVLIKDGLLAENDTVENLFTVRLGKGIENIYVKA